MSKSSSIKILHIIKSLGRGGAEMLLPEAIKLHDSRKFEFHCIYFLPWKDQMVSELRVAGALVTCFSASNNIRLMMQAEPVISYIRQHHIDVVHCHLPWAGFLGRYIFCRTGIPTVYTEHNKQERYHWATYWLNRLTFNWQRVAIAVSDDVKKSIMAHIKPKVEVKTILNGVNTDFFQRSQSASPDLFLFAHHLPSGIEEAFKISNPTPVSFLVPHKKLGQASKSQKPTAKSQQLIPNTQPPTANSQQPTAIIVGTVAVFRFQKRLKEWLEVFALARQQIPNLLGVIVGAGPLDGEIRAHRAALGLENYVLMPGLQTDTRKWYSAMDVFMMTSSFEGLPIALLEAMSMQCAIVSTRAGGIGEVVEDGKSGILVEVDNWRQLSEKLVQLSNPDTRLQMGKAARARVKEKFSMQRMVRELEETYLSLAEG